MRCFLGKTTVNCLLLDLCFQCLCIYTLQQFLPGNRIICIDIHCSLYIVPLCVFKRDNGKIFLFLYFCDLAILCDRCRIFSCLFGKIPCIEHEKITNINCRLAVQIDIGIYIRREIKVFIFYCNSICCRIQIRICRERQHIRLKDNILGICIFVAITISGFSCNLYICQITILFCGRIKGTQIRSETCIDRYRISYRKFTLCIVKFSDCQISRSQCTVAVCLIQGDM